MGAERKRGDCVVKKKENRITNLTIFETLPSGRGDVGGGQTKGRRRTRSLLGAERGTDERRKRKLFTTTFVRAPAYVGSTVFDEKLRYFFTRLDDDGNFYRAEQRRRPTSYLCFVVAGCSWRNPQPFVIYDNLALSRKNKTGDIIFYSKLILLFY